MTWAPTKAAVRLGLYQTVIEYIPGVGVVTDGVTDATSLNGPWTLTVPAGVSDIIADGVTPGGGGGGGFGSTVSRAGGGAGASGIHFSGLRLLAKGGDVLTITLGAAGTGGAVGAAGTGGGSITIAGLKQTIGVTNGSLVIGAAQTGGGAATSGGSGSGGGHANTITGASKSNAASPTSGDIAKATNEAFGGANYFPFATGQWVAFNAASGGAASTTGTVAGANGGFSWEAQGGAWPNVMRGYGNALAGAGNTDGTNSYGGGGWGSHSLFGKGGSGGNGNVAGGNATGYGAGGGGGGGNAAGGNGAPAYLRLTFAYPA